ncbi:MAG: fibronectin type III domain-containing protein [bacterium]|nr:fibronectin type III domain-containing protein [bacterium]
MGNFRKVFTIGLYLVLAVILTSGTYFVIINFDYSFLKIDEAKAVTCPGGVSYGGYCYYPGSANTSCTQTCAAPAISSTCDAAGLTYAYDATRCAAIGALLITTSTFNGTSYAGNIGCSYNTATPRWRLTNTAPACANNTSGSSNYPACACAGITVPASPGSFAATAASSTAINLTWTDVTNETSYRIERALESSPGSATSGTFTTIASPAINITTYQDAGLPAATLYYYKIYAVNVGGDSIASLASATTLVDSSSNLTDTNNISDFKVQRNCTIAKAASTTVTLVAGAHYDAPGVNGTSSAFIRLVSTRGSGMGLILGGGSQKPNEFTWYINDPDFTDGLVQFKRDAVSSGDERFCWEIVEYVGPSSGSNEMKVRSALPVTYSASNPEGLTVNGSATTVVNSNKVVVFITGQNSISNGSAQEISGGQSTAEWNSISSYPIFTRGITQTNANSLSYAVVEFTGSNWKVQRVEHQFVAAGVVEVTTTIDIGSLSRAFFHSQFRRSGSDSMLNAGPEVWLSATNVISFLLDSAASTPSNKTAVVWLVSNSDESSSGMKVQHISGTRLTPDISEGTSNPNEDEWTKTISTIRSTSSASIMGENGISTGGGTTVPYGWLSLYLNSSSSVKLYQSDDARTQNYRFQVVEWPLKGVQTGLSAHRFFNNTNSNSVGAAYAAQNATAALINSGDAFRLRTLINVTSTNPTASLATSSQKYFLQFAKKNGDCDTGFSGEGYANISSSTVIAFKNNLTPVDGNSLTASSGDPLVVGHTVVPQSYVESNPFTNNQSSILAGKDGLWDFSLYDNGAPAGTTYCIRAINDKPWTLKNNIQIVPNKFKDITTATSAVDMVFSADGANMYIPRDLGVVDQYSLSTPWDVTTAVSIGNFNFVTSFGDDTARIPSIAFKSDGTKMYALWSNQNKIYQFSLSEAWNVSTAVYDNVYKSIYAQTGASSKSPWALTLSKDGSKLYIGTLTYSSIYQYKLTENWNLATLVYDNVYLTFDGAVVGITFNSDGTKMYLAGGGPIGGFYANASPNWLQRIWAYLFAPLNSLMTWLSTPYAKAFAGGGVGMSIYSLVTPWDIRTTTYDGVIGVGAPTDPTEGIAINADGNQIYYLSMTNQAYTYTVEQYAPVNDFYAYLDSYSSIAEITTAGPTFGSLIQKNYRWYKDVNTKDPSNSESVSAENTEMSNLVLGRKRHLRISVTNPSGVFSSGQKFKLQYQRSTTTASWTDVGPSSAFTGYDICTTCADGEAITALRLTGSTIKQTYEEPTGTAISTTTPNAINDGAVAEWDWALTTNGALTAGAPYYFRMVGSDGTVFGTYQNYPKLTISSDNYTSGEVTSVIYDTGSSTGSQLNSFYWDGSQPQVADFVKFQFASASTTTPLGGWNFVGPQGIGGDSDWYQPTGPNIPQSITPEYHKNYRYFRFKVRLGSSSGISPVIKRVIVNWSP